MRLTEAQLVQLRKARGNGNRVAKAIELADVTLVAVAAETDLPYSYVSDVARNRYPNVTVHNAHKFADCFGCLIEDLFPAREALAS